MVSLGQVERPHSWALQARMRRKQDDCALLEVLLHRGTGGRKKEVMHEGGFEKTKRDDVAAFQGSVGWQQGHGNQH